MRKGLCAYLEPTLLRIISDASPIVKLPGFWRGGNSSNVCRKRPT